MPGRIRDICDLQLQVLLMESIRSPLDDSGESISVCPQDIFEIELKAVVSILLAGINEGADHRRVCLVVPEKIVYRVLVEYGDDGEQRDVILLGGTQHHWIRLTIDEPSLVYPVPRRNDDIDFGAMLHEVADRLRLIGHIKERFRLGEGRCPCNHE